MCQTKFNPKIPKGNQEMIISEKIFTLLEQRKMSQKEFSEKTGISQSTISDWKRKRTNPSADKIMKICEVLCISPYELLSEEHAPDSGISPDYSIVLSNEGRLLLECYRNFSSQQKNRLQGYLQALQELN